jgi:hypothetical protein
MSTTRLRMTLRLRVAGTSVGLLALALLVALSTPGSILAGPLAELRRQAGQLLPAPFQPRPPGPELASTAGIGASRRALADIPSHYLAVYVHTDQAMHKRCPRLRWQLLAAIGKVESDHGRASAPGVHSGVNRFGCCSGPMQFNLTNGPPSTWQSFKRPGDSVYNPADAIPAAARKLCADGLAGPKGGRDPCPQVRGSAAEHRALMRYNHACWYAHQVLTIADRYTREEPTGAAARDPFVRALTGNPRITTTTSHGCHPAPDLASGRLDLRVQALLAALAERHRIRISCLHAGHSNYVKGTRRVSNHFVWRAMDLDRVDGQPVSPTSHAARELVAWLDRLDGPLRPSEVGSPFPLGHRPYFSDDGHQRHIHIGYGPALTGQPHSRRSTRPVRKEQQIGHPSWSSSPLSDRFECARPTGEVSRIRWWRVPDCRHNRQVAG